MKLLLLHFVYLQLMDLLTTLAFLAHGGREMNPLVAALLQMHPLIGLAAAKGFAIALAVYSVLGGRETLLKRVNAFYAVVIVWNTVAIISGPQ